MSLRVVMVIMFMVLCVEFPRNVGATGKNDDSYDNNLGLLAQVCASNYCNSATNALDLWISVEEVCRLLHLLSRLLHLLKDPMRPRSTTRALKIGRWSGFQLVSVWCAFPAPCIARGVWWSVFVNYCKSCSTSLATDSCDMRTLHIQSYATLQACTLRYFQIQHSKPFRWFLCASIRCYPSNTATCPWHLSACSTA